MSEIEPILNPPAPPAGTADGATRMQNFIERVKVPQATRASIAVLLAMFLCGASSTEFVAHVALVPGRTIPYVWNVFTASWLEVNPLGFIVSCAAAILTGRIVEPAMGAKEYARFLAVCTACVGGAAFVSMLFLYYGQRDEKILYEPICGFQGLVASLLVAVRQLMPDAPVNVRGLRTLRCRHLPAIHLAAMTAVAALQGRYLEKFGFTFFGLYGAWVYLRYYQPRPDGGGHGDASSEHMEFISFFPAFTAPVLGPFADGVHACCVGRRERRALKQMSAAQLHDGLAVVNAGNKPGVTTRDAEEAKRRRERGAKALAERLAEKQRQREAAAAAGDAV